MVAPSAQTPTSRATSRWSSCRFGSVTLSGATGCTVSRDTSTGSLAAVASTAFTWFAIGRWVYGQTERCGVSLDLGLLQQADGSL